MSGISSMFSGPDKSAERRQAKLLAQQEASQRRDQLRTNEREQDLSKQDAAQRRAIVARRRGNQSLAYTGPLKTKLGG